MLSLSVLPAVLELVLVSKLSPDVAVIKSPFMIVVVLGTSVVKLGNGTDSNVVDSCLIVTAIVDSFKSPNLLTITSSVSDIEVVITSMFTTVVRVTNRILGNIVERKG